MADSTPKTYKASITNLKQIDFFIADEIDLFSFRDDMHSMEYPYFALKQGDFNERVYTNKNITTKVQPSTTGLATIFDKDIWIYAISKMQQAINNGNQIDREIYFTPYDFLKCTNRSKGGKAYKDLESTLDRLRGTIIKQTTESINDTSIETFGLIQDYKIIEDVKGKLEVGMIKIVIPEWLFQKLKKKQVLKINMDYFNLRKALDRRLYEIARKHCGNQFECEIGLEKLYYKTGSTSSQRKFRFNIKQLADDNNLPDYEVIFDSERDVVIFKNRNPDTLKANKMKSIKKGNNVLNRIKKQIRCN